MKLSVRVAYFLSLPIVLVAVWAALTWESSNFFVPSPLEVGTTFVDVWVGDRFWRDVIPSVTRLACGLFIAILLGAILGLVIGSIRWLRELVEPLFEFIRAIPATILVPILLLLVGLNDTSKIAVIVIGSIWPILLNTVEGVRAIDSVQSDTAKVYGVTGRFRLWYLIMPSTSPQMMAGIRQSLSIGLILMVVSEMFAATEGIGFAVIQFQRIFAIPEMWSGIILLGILGVVLAVTFQFAQSRILAWYYGQKEVADAS